MNSTVAPALFTPSWHAELELAYARFGDCTRPVMRRHLGPLRVQKHLYAEGPEVCQHIIVHPPGGIAGGDRLDISARVEPAPGRRSPAPARPSGIALVARPIRSST
jgi:urease accessory protein